MRVGIGFDAHRLTEGRPLVIGGVTVPYSRGLEGHSDADVLLHAICDALLGALCLGDIGTHFPGGDERYRDIRSTTLLSEVGRMIEGRGYRVENVDATVIAQDPRLSPYIEKMRSAIAETLSCKETAVSVKATTSEGMGYCGRGEGVAALAVVSLVPRGGG